MHFENQLALGNGIYTLSEISQILRIPYGKVNRWVNQYWDGELGKRYESAYSWTVQDTRAIGFHTLVEFYMLVQLGEAGVPTRNVLKAHQELSEIFDTAFPFARKDVIDNIRVDGKKIYFDIKGDILSLDGTKQFNLSYIRDFVENLDFDHDEIATRLWPLGKDRKVIIDPHRQFGHPVLGETNIYPETLFSLHKAGESTSFIAITYEIDEELVKDAIAYCKAA
ncbi:MAG: DUF433 domain-containing protein [Cyclobacteriaceae bacterium]